MLLLKHNALSVEDLFTIERQLLRWLDNKETEIGLDFNVLNLKRVDIYGHLLGIFTRLGCLETLHITPSELLDFLIDVDTAYLNAPYHSFYHAVDIVFVIYFILTKLEAIHYFNHLHISAILIAGLCHDIGHPGYNNVYQVNFKTELATKYNNESVLEAYSADLTKSLLLEKHVNFVNGMTIEIKNQWMEQIEKLILQTDMKYHFTLQEQAGLLEEIVYQQCIEHNFMKGCDTPNTNSSTTLKHSSNDYLVEENHETDYFNLLIPPSSPPSDYITTAPTSQFKNYQTLPSQWVVPNVTLSPSCFFNTTAQYESNLSSGGTKMTSSLSNDTTIFQPTFNDEQCIQFLSILLHAADISNTVRPWHLSKQWSDLIVQEFFRQGDYEKLAGMDVSPGMDRDVSNQPDISLTFGDLLVRPYFEALTNLLPDAYIFLDILENNRDEWLNLKLKTQDQEKSPSQQLPTKLNNKRLSVIQYPNGHPYNDQQQQQQQHIQERQFPNGLLPIPKSSLSDKSNATATIKSERRVSVAAGTISIPDDLDLSGKSNKYKGRRGQAGLRSYSLVTDRVDIFRKFSYVPPPRNHRSSTLPVIHKRMSLHPQSSVLATSSPLTSTISNHSNQSSNHHPSKTPSSYFSLLLNLIRNHTTIYILLYILLFIILYVLLKN